MKSASSILALVAILAAHGAGASEADRQQAAENFVEADVDANGALTLSEFTTLIDLNAEDDLGVARLVKRSGRYQTAFRRLDADADGRVSVEEMAAAAQGS